MCMFNRLNYSPLYTVHCTVNSVHYTSYSVYCTYLMDYLGKVKNNFNVQHHIASTKMFGVFYKHGYTDIHIHIYTHTYVYTCCIYNHTHTRTRTHAHSHARRAGIHVDIHIDTVIHTHKHSLKLCKLSRSVIIYSFLLKT